MTRNRFALNSILPLYLAPDDGTGDGGTDEGDGGQEEHETGDSEKKLTQAQVTRIATAEKDKGARAARAALLEELGITDPKEAKRLIDQAKSQAEKNKSETEKAQTKATEAAERAERAEREAASLKRERAAERALIRQVPDRALARLTKMVVSELGDADPEDGDAVKAAIEAVKEELPELFGEDSEETPARRLPSGETKGGGGKPPAKVKTTDAMSRGAARAQKYQGRTATA